MGLTDSEIYRKDMELLQSADVVVADCTAPSLGVGFIISKAISLKKPIICTYFYDDHTKLSAMINGCPDIVTGVYTTKDDFEKCVREFLVKSINSMKIYLCGPPGSGKSTVAKRLAETFGLVNVSTGQILRDIAKQPANPLTSILDKYISSGQLVPANIMKDIVINRLTSPDCLEHGFVLDGYPPSKEDLENLIIGGICPDFVFYFECSDETAIKRQCTRQERVTDLEPAAKERVRVFHENIPSYEYIREHWFSNLGKALIIRVNAEQPSHIVSTSIEQMIINNNSTEKSASYFPIYPFDSSFVNTNRFHFHVDASSYQDLLDVIHDINVVCPELHGQIKVYPIRDLSLGCQIEKYNAYKSMINFHQISEKNNEAFATGRLGAILDISLIKKVLHAVKHRRNQSAKIMIELEQYIGEWSTNSSNNNKTVDTHKPIGVNVELFSDYQSSLVPEIPPIELHLAFDIPKNGTSQPPIDLVLLNTECKKMKFDNGGWFIFQNENVWAYRSNEFTFDKIEDAELEIHYQAYELQNKIDQMLKLKINIDFSLELVHGIWVF